MNDKSGINSDIGKEVLDAYFELKNKRLTGETLQKIALKKVKTYEIV